MNIRMVRFLAFVSLVFLLSACSQRVSALEIGENAPDFSLADMNGKTAGLSDFKGKVVILNFFANWCPPCRQEVPDFIQLEKAYGDKGFAMVGIALVSAREAKNFANEMGINYTVLIDDGKVSELYGPIRSIPTTFVLNKNGKIAKFYIGFRSKEVFEADIQELIK